MVRIIPIELEKLLIKRKKNGYLTFKFEDKLEYIRWHIKCLKDIPKAKLLIEELFEEINDILKLDKLPKFKSKKDYAKYLLELQNPDTGSWTEYPTANHIEIERAQSVLKVIKKAKLQPKYEVKFLDKYKTKKKLKEYLNLTLHDYNRNNRKELNVGITKLITLQTKVKRFYNFEDGWLDVFFDFFQEWQDPKTGFWGPWVKENNKIVKKTDLSITFHIIRRYYNSDGSLKNSNFDINHKNKIIETLFKIQDENYPNGWLEQGKFSSHHSFDVTDIINLFYDNLESKTKKNIVNLYEDFLQKVMNNEKRGGFEGYIFWQDEPTIESTNFAVELLNNIGYFNPNIRDKIIENKIKKVNSYRIYKNKLPKEEFDSTNLIKIIYPKNYENYDNLDLRKRIYEYLSVRKEFDLFRENVEGILYLNEFKPTKFLIEEENNKPVLENDDILVKVNKFGKILE